MSRPRALPWATLALLLSTAACPAAEPKVAEFQAQKAGGVTYIRVRFRPPADLRLPQSDWWTPEAPVARMPRLVPQDGRSRLVYPAAGVLARYIGRGVFAWTSDSQTPYPDSEALTFVGRLEQPGAARFRLLYPTERVVKLPPLAGKIAGRQTVPSWQEVALTLDPADAADLKEPAEAAKRRAWVSKPGLAAPLPHENDLEGQWAAGQAAAFAVLDYLSAGDGGFHAFAQEATNRKYHISVLSPPRRGDEVRPDASSTGSLYELTTGATAIAESLQMNRFLRNGDPDPQRREVDVSTLRGIDIAQHPWKEMIGDRKPAREPLADLVPDDNYLVTFKSLPKLATTRHLLDAWGGNLLSAFSLSSRDHGLAARYERQLCLSADGLAASVPARAVRSVAITGTDGYLVEGSDVTVLVDAADPDAFRQAAEPYLAAARKEFGRRLREGKEEYQGVTIERFRTPLREVSLYRATLGEVLVYSNSPAGVRRVIDAARGKRASLARSLDYQYMRTIYRSDDPAEDGFAFLSDPFVRQLVGPASRIQRKRRCEALAGLTLATNAALFTAWETGRLPEDERLVLASAELKPGMLAMPEGGNAVWDAREGRAIHEVYGTLAFSTPLAEIPIDQVTRQEAADYERFRLEYLGLWRRYFDPIGMRIHLSDRQVRLETYILPLIQNSAYNELRRLSGSGTTRLDPTSFSPKTVFQLTQHIDPGELVQNNWLRSRDPGSLAMVAALNFAGDWFSVRIEDSEGLAKLASMLLRTHQDPWRRQEPSPVLARAFWQTRVTTSVSVQNPVALAGTLASLKSLAELVLPGGVEWGPVDDGDNKEIVRVRPKANRETARLFGNDDDARDPFLPTIYYTLADGVFHVGLNLEAIQSVVASAKARKDGKPGTVEVNASVYFAPGAAVESASVLKAYLEYETHKHAQAALPARYILYRTGAVPPDATPEAVRAASLRLYGYEAVAPDGTAVEYRPEMDEVRNARHGSIRRPKRAAEPDPASPAALLLERFRSVRADLRFKEDGVQTTVTLTAK